MNHIPVGLKEVDSIEVITLMDNYVDVLLGDSDIVTRPPLAKGEEIPTDTLVAEHGLSLLVTLQQGEQRHTILFDTGHTKHGVLHNAGWLDINLKEVDAIVMSHAHMDHTGSLYPVLNAIERPVKLIIHPEAFTFPRYRKSKDGRLLRFPRTLIKEELMARKVEVREAKEPTLFFDDRVMITGEVKRTTDFEKGLINALLERDGKLEPDPIADDQALAVHLKGKGLVIISGCSHAGIINTIRFAGESTGIRDIHALLGGFHLSGPEYEPIIERTIEELKTFNPHILVPMHCTGWRAINRFSEAFPAAFILNSVGSKYTMS